MLSAVQSVNVMHCVVEVNLCTGRQAPNGNHFDCGAINYLIIITVFGFKDL